MVRTFYFLMLVQIHLFKTNRVCFHRVFFTYYYSKAFEKASSLFQYLKHYLTIFSKKIDLLHFQRV